jgi:hypothetical protein
VQALVYSPVLRQEVLAITAGLPQMAGLAEAEVLVLLAVTLQVLRLARVVLDICQIAQNTIQVVVVLGLAVQVDGMLLAVLVPLVIHQIMVL